MPSLKPIFSLLIPPRSFQPDWAMAEFPKFQYSLHHCHKFCLLSIEFSLQKSYLFVYLRNREKELLSAHSLSGCPQQRRARMQTTWGAWNSIQVSHMANSCFSYHHCLLGSALAGSWGQDLQIKLRYFFLGHRVSELLG